ncbi:MAG: hypothetical protein R6V12_12550, partial [Candidatus Hydrogenedentota bacterium]
RILNQIVAENEDSPLANMLSAKTAPIGRTIAVALLAGGEGLQVEHFAVGLRQGRFTMQGRAEMTGKKPVWRVPLETVKDTVERQEYFHAHPEELDLRWIQSGIFRSHET